MINFVEKKSKTRIPQHDYVLDKEEFYLRLLDVLTPKFDGVWTIALVDPKITFIDEYLVEAQDVPYIEVNVYLPVAKLEMVMLKHTKLAPKKQSSYEAYMALLGEMTNTLEHDASKYLYKACSGSIDTLTEVVEKLDKECESGRITIKDVKQVCVAVKKPLYASTVYEAFMVKDRDRWSLLERLEQELGTSYCYYALKKQSVKWFEDKCKYLSNEDVKNYNIRKVDAPFITYAYVCFSNSRNVNELYTVMYDIDNRCKEALDRRLYADLQ